VHRDAPYCFLQHLLPPRLQKIRHYGFLSRRSNIDLDDVRAAVLESLKDIEPDLELEAWTVPSLRPASHSGEDDGPRCPNCGGPLVFERFHRIRPPPPSTTNPAHRKSPNIKPGLLEQKIRTRLREFLIHWCYAGGVAFSAEWRLCSRKPLGKPGVNGQSFVHKRTYFFWFLEAAAKINEGSGCALDADSLSLSE
jgi:hypothetical protein